METHDEQHALREFAVANVLSELYEQDPNATMPERELLERAHRMVAEWNSKPDLKAKILALLAEPS